MFKISQKATFPAAVHHSPESSGVPALSGGLMVVVVFSLTQIRRPRQADPLQRRDQRRPQQPTGEGAEGGGVPSQGVAVLAGPGRHHRE